MKTHERLSCEKITHILGMRVIFKKIHIKLLINVIVVLMHCIVYILN